MSHIIGLILFLQKSEKSINLCQEIRILIEDEKYCQQCPLQFSTTIWNRFERLIDEDKDDKKIYLVERLPSKEFDPEERPIFDHDELVRWRRVTGRLSDRCYKYAVNLVMELEPIDNVIFDNNRKWICAFRSNSIAYVKIGDLSEEEVRKDLENFEDLGNVLKTNKKKGMH